jgi:hypothetical protein
VLALVLSLFIASPGSAAQNPPRRDTRAWYQAYSDGTRAFQQRRWQEAIDSFEAAKRAAGAPKPGRRVPSYGDNFVDFIPDYYLGVAYTNLNQYGPADRAFAAVRASGLIGPRDREYAEFQKLSGMASAQLKVPSTVAGIANPPAAGNAGNTLAANQPADNPNPAIQQPIPPSNNASAAVQQPPPQTNNPLANAGLPAPIGRGTPAATAGNAGGKAPAPRPISPTPQNRPIAPGAVAAANEQAAIGAYLSGQYDQVETLIGKDAAANAATPRAYFYLACSQTALAILGRADANAVNNARTTLSRAGDPAQFAADRRYISPRVLQMLGLNQ